MPKSRNRPKPKSGRYRLEPQRRRKARTSPRWYGPVVLGLMGVGVVLIVWNYTRGTEASNTILLVGLGLIAVGFFGTTFWR
jgi:drug/metabolite transporter (DMT)-like permease